MYAQDPASPGRPEEDSLSKNPGQLLPVGVENTELDKPMAGLCIRYFLGMPCLYVIYCLCERGWGR